MEAFVNIIIWVLVIVSFVNKLKKKNKGNSSDRRRDSEAERMNAGPVRSTGRKIPSGGIQSSRTKTKEIGDFSTTEYLEQKAKKEELAARQERYQEWKQNKKETGEIPAAKRLYEGDSVPRGMEQVRCSYCGADNLIPEGSTRKYACYFCREEL